MKDMHGLIFAYAAHLRLKELTERRTAASIPFGSRYRCIDFMMSNMVHAGIVDIGVVMRDSYQSLLDHLGSGKDWDLARKRGGLQLLPPFGFAGARRDHNTYRGRMEALYGVAAYISHIREKYVVLADGDVIANINLDEMFEDHLRTGADITCMCTKKPSAEGEDEAFYRFNENRRITDVTVGPTEGDDIYETMNVFIISKALLENLLSHCVARNLHHFHRDVIQAMRDKLNLVAYPYEGYVARLTSVSTYFNHSMDLLRPEVRRDLFNRERSIRTKVRDEPPSYYAPGSLVKNSLVADGCFVEGTVENCVLFRGVRVEKGAVVQNCVLMQDTVVKAGAKLQYAIADKQVRVGENHILMGHETYPIAISKDAIV